MTKPALRRWVLVFLAASLLVDSPAAHAAVEDEAPNGFTISETTDVAATPERVYAALIAPQSWWSSEHTYSHDAANLRLDTRAGGCWCEMLPKGGSVQHLVVVNVIPGKLLRLRGALGPLQGMAVDGAMTFSLHAHENSTQITLTYVVGGYDVCSPRTESTAFASSPKPCLAAAKAVAQSTKKGE